jgi:hypothetical protein
MSVEYQIHQLPNRVEAAAELHWYAGCGYYKVNVVGFGADEASAVKSAGLMLGQARAAIHVASIGSELIHRVPATPTENAQGAG